MPLLTEILYFLSFPRQIISEKRDVFLFAAGKILIILLKVISLLV